MKKMITILLLALLVQSPLLWAKQLQQEKPVVAKKQAFLSDNWRWIAAATAGAGITAWALYKAPRVDIDMFANPALQELPGPEYDRIATLLKEGYPRIAWLGAFGTAVALYKGIEKLTKPAQEEIST